MNETMNTTTTTPTPENRGLLPIGTEVYGFGTIAEVSLTAYRFDGPCLALAWVSFDRVHGRPAPVTPLVSFA